MGNERYNPQTINDHKTIFLPMFCRLSLKDVKAPITATAAEPSSPKVTCIGQVKRNNRVSGYPTTTPAAFHHHHKHTTKPKKLLPPTKTLLPNPVGRSGSRSCRRNDFRKATAKSNKCDQDCRKAAVEVDIGEMDPPLPVVKRVAPPGNGRDEVNIWKRRFNGVKKMEIEPICLPSNNSFQLPPTTSL